MNDMNVLQRLFRYKAQADERMVAATRGLDSRSPATEVALRVLGHAHVVDRIFAAHLTSSSHGYSSANPAETPVLDSLAAKIRDTDRWYVDYVEHLNPGQLAESIGFAFTDGDPGRMSREEMLIHVITHALKFDLGGEGFVFIDGTTVANDDRPAGLTLRIALDDLRALCEGRLTLIAALASGRLVVSDMGIAAGLRSAVEALLARLR